MVPGGVWRQGFPAWLKLASDHFELVFSPKNQAFAGSKITYIR